jgi:O-antigen ligase
VVPGTNQPIAYLKVGDVAVHLAGAAAFILLGFFQPVGWRRIAQPVLWAAWLGAAVVVAALNRGGALAMSTALLTAPLAARAGRWLMPVLVGLLLVGVVSLVNLEVDVGGRRSLSADQLLDNVESIFGASDNADLQGTRRWREAWWSTIVDYTIGGPYLWDGKGYGVNLAREDGFQVEPDLRAPHSAHLNLLARSGIIGLSLWVAIQVAFAATMFRAGRLAARAGQAWWLGAVGWIGIYWAAAVVNMSFDVYLEGPQGGILYWTVVGAGIAVAAAVRELADEWASEAAA